MKNKIIDCKNKEMYFHILPLREEKNLENSRYTFWAQMNNMAMQNIMVQQMKRA